METYTKTFQCTNCDTRVTKQIQKGITISIFLKDAKCKGCGCQTLVSFG